MRRLRLLVVLTVASLMAQARAGSDAVWQWSVPVGESRAYLWIPENCQRVRGVLFAQHNMIERGILEHPMMRGTLADCGMAEVFFVPSIDPVFRFDQGAGERFEAVMHSLAEISGYPELADAPVVPMGHSAHASFPWNFAAWNPARTLAVLSVKGDAPQTDLTGSGRPNPDWEKGSLDGVPGLMVMGEYEWWEKRLDPLVRFRNEHPQAPLALLADVGHGHFDATNTLVDFLALFVRKAVSARLPDEGSVALRAVDPKGGWLVDRWRGDDRLKSPAAPYESFEGDRAEAFWCFDEEMARATEARYGSRRGKKPQNVGFQQNGAFVPISNSHAGTEVRFLPDADGLTFHLGAGFILPLPPNPPVATKDKRPPVVTVTPDPAPEGEHAAGDVDVSLIVGPVVELSEGTFRVALDRMFPAADGKPVEAWFLAQQAGDGSYKGAVRQSMMRVTPASDGTPQTIHFPEIGDVKAGTESIPMDATSDCGLPVGCYVREGPAFVRGNTIHITPLPPRAKLPVKVTVVAWQLGRMSEPKVRSAEPVVREFLVR